MITRCIICGMEDEYRPFFFDYDLGAETRYTHGTICLCKEHAEKLMPVIQDKVAEIEEAVKRVREKWDKDEVAYYDQGSAKINVVKTWVESTTGGGLK